MRVVVAVYDVGGGEGDVGDGGGGGNAMARNKELGSACLRCWRVPAQCDECLHALSYTHTFYSCAFVAKCSFEDDELFACNVCWSL